MRRLAKMNYNEAYTILLQVSDYGSYNPILAPEVKEALNVLLSQSRVESGVSERLDRLIAILQEMRKTFP
jgi:hypothetical protein